MPFFVILKGGEKMDNTTFIFDGVKSTDMGLYNIKIDSGFYSTPYVSGQDIIEDNIPNSHIPYFYGVKKKPLEFQLTFSMGNEKFTEDQKFKIARWLIKEEYCEFQITDYLGKIFNVIAVSNVEFMSGGTKEGYFQITFRCDAPWAWSPISIQNYDLSSITTPTVIELFNKSNVLQYHYPEIEFKLYGTNTGILLKNLSDGGREFEFTGLNVNEKIYVNNKNTRIETDAPSVYRLGNFNKKWLRLVQGVNRIEVIGQCQIQIKNRFPLYI